VAALLRAVCAENNAALLLASHDPALLAASPRILALGIPV
jgi:hypothetical protein